MNSRESFRIQSLLEFAQGYINEIRCFVREKLNVIAGADQSRNISSAHLDNPSAGVAYKHSFNVICATLREMISLLIARQSTPHPLQDLSKPFAAKRLQHIIEGA